MFRWRGSWFDKDTASVYDYKMNTLIDYIPAAQAAEMIGYASGSKASTLRILARSGKIPGAIKIGRDWLLPAAWVQNKVQEKKERLEAGRPFAGKITTGAGVQRKDRGGPGGDPYATGKPRGRPSKPLEERKAYKPTGKPRGRPPISAEERKVYQPTGKPRGRAKKTQTDTDT